MSAAKTGRTRQAPARKRDRAPDAVRPGEKPRRGGSPKASEAANPPENAASPKSGRRARMLTALGLAAERMNVVPAGPVVWSAGDRAVGRPTDRADGRRTWLRLQASPVAEANGEQWQGNKTAEFAFGALGGHRPRLLGLLDWVDAATRAGGQGAKPDDGTVDKVAYRAELTEYVRDLVCSPTPVAHGPHDLPDAWWDGLHAALDAVGEARTQRVTTRQEVVDRLVPEYLGVRAPTLRTMVPVHGDLHWANVTRDTPCLLDWERWGRAPLGYDAAMLHAHSLLVPGLASRVRGEFPVLDSADGRIAELVVTAELLHALRDGGDPEAEHALRAQARRLTEPRRRSVRVHLPGPARPMTTVSDSRL
ncbi:aminoglycoside phosphotransferase family protein [Yinghuangia sp. ASG 101]|uniref:aminoglycoside phosphotransferase family protein n=1 Tax=Yinghuangia sp. ASG 101 TaxID=2896848 RepID=UPI001E59055A|nr:aminoglycoside phosphotransferase family protein [Yinghuangia sp. ASG 101]UGQ14879.1 aminoglycoside phosphotransferase family protein [Yinghuangia sp. ASG 101]